MGTSIVRKGTEVGAGGVVSPQTPLAAGVRRSRLPENFYISNANSCILVHSWQNKWTPATLKNLAII